MSVNREELGPTVSGNPMIHTCPYRWVRHLVTCISKYQTPGRAPSAREEGECTTEWEEQPSTRESLPFPRPMPQLKSPGPLHGSANPICAPPIPTLDCYSETEAEDPDEEAGSRSASVSRVSLPSRR